VKEAVRDGIGVSILSQQALAAEEKAGQLHALRRKGVKLQRKFYIVRHATRTQSPIAKAFLGSRKEQRGKA
jgi:DNA-binding transcriptional LysR family regulator